MNEVEIMSSVSCLVILGAALWACLNQNVRDGIILKIALFFVVLGAYLELALHNNHSKNILIISIASACLVAFAQKYIFKKRLFCRVGDQRDTRNSHAA